MAYIPNIKVLANNKLELSGNEIVLSGAVTLQDSMTLTNVSASALTASSALVGTLQATSAISASQLTASSGRVDTLNVLTLEALTNISASNLTASNALVSGDLVITGKLTAAEYHTQVVSASIIYQSGSTKFGDSSDDTHQFTGSVLVTGSSVTLVGGQFNGSGAGLTNIPNAALDNSSVTLNGQTVSLGDSLTTVAAGTNLNSSTSNGTVTLSLADSVSGLTSVAATTGSFSKVDGSFVLSRANGGTGVDLSAAATNGQFLVFESDTLTKYTLSGSAPVSVTLDTDNDKLVVGFSGDYVSSITLGNGLENSGSSITTTGTIAVSASSGGGINVGPSGLSVDDSVVVTTTGAGSYSLAAALSSSVGLSGSQGYFGSLVAGELSLNGFMTVPVTSVSGNTTLGADDFVVLADSSSGTLTVTLPSSTIGRKLIVKKINSNSNGVVLSSASLIDGQSTYTLFAQYQSVSLVGSSSGWMII